MITWIIMGFVTFTLMLALTTYAWIKESRIILEVTGINFKDVFTTYLKDFFNGIKQGLLELDKSIWLVLLTILMLYFVIWPIGLCLVIKGYSEVRGFTK